MEVASIVTLYHGAHRNIHQFVNLWIIVELFWNFKWLRHGSAKSIHFNDIFGWKRGNVLVVQLRWISIDVQVGRQ